MGGDKEICSLIDNVPYLFSVAKFPKQAELSFPQSRASPFLFDLSTSL